MPLSASIVANDERVLEARLAEDLTRIDEWRRFQLALLSELERLMLRGENTPLTTLENARLVRTWSALVDLQLALDVVDRRWRDRSNLRESSFDRAVATSYAAWLARNTAASAVVRLGRAHPDYLGVLDEALPELGLPAGSWSRIAQNSESARTATEYMAYEALYAHAVEAGRIPSSPAVVEDSARISTWLRERGVAASAINASRLLSSDPGAAFNTLTSVGSPWFGQAQRMRPTRPFIGTAWVSRITPQIQPGDLILIRHEWEPMDPGHDSFWGQAGIWIGAPSERRHYFGDPSTLAALRADGYEDIDALLRAQAPSAYGASLAPGAEPMRLIVTTPHGVTLVGASALQADSIAVLRLRRSPLERARLVERALDLVGRGWDAAGNADDHSTVGSAELLLTALDSDAPRLAFARPGLDDLVKWFDAHAGDDNPTFEFVAMLDGDEWSRNVSLQSSDIFRKSWARPIWRSWLNAAGLNQRR